MSNKDIPPPTKYFIEPSIRETHIDCAVGYFWEAFGSKLNKILYPVHKAHIFLKNVMDPSYAVSAVDTSGKLLGVAGFKTPTGAFIRSEIRDLIEVYGYFGSLWRGALLHVLERPCEEGVLLMDGIFVGSHAQGLGVGSALLQAIMKATRQQRLTSIRLDVIDSNVRARTLYERHGFYPSDQQKLGILSPIFGFESVTTMRLDQIL